MKSHKMSTRLFTRDTGCNSHLHPKNWSATEDIGQAPGRILSTHSKLKSHSSHFSYLLTGAQGITATLHTPPHQMRKNKGFAQHTAAARDFLHMSVRHGSTQSWVSLPITHMLNTCVHVWQKVLYKVFLNHERSGST